MGGDGESEGEETLNVSEIASKNCLGRQDKVIPVHF